MAKPMYLFGENANEILVDCKGCGRVLRIPATSASRTSHGYTVLSGILCKCGNTATEVIDQGKVRTPITQTSVPDHGGVKCPNCGSSQIHAEKRGFTLTTGLIGKNRIYITCLQCGKRFKPGEGRQTEAATKPRLRTEMEYLQSILTPEEMAERSRRLKRYSLAALICSVLVTSVLAFSDEKADAQGIFMFGFLSLFIFELVVVFTVEFWVSRLQKQHEQEDASAELAQSPHQHNEPAELAPPRSKYLR